MAKKVNQIPVNQIPVNEITVNGLHQGLASFNVIMLNPQGMGVTLPNHQQAILKAYVEICKDKKKFVPVTLQSIVGFFNRLELESVTSLLPNDLTPDLSILHRKGWITSAEKSFELTDHAKQELHKAIQKSTQKSTHKNEKPVTA
jgi:hypothetical protein